MFCQLGSAITPAAGSRAAGQHSAKRHANGQGPEVSLFHSLRLLDLFLPTSYPKEGLKAMGKRKRRGRKRKVKTKQIT